MRALVVGLTGMIVLSADGWQVGAAYGAWAPIEGVGIVPDPPTTTDPITIGPHGEIGSTDWHIDHANYQMSGRLLSLDIFFGSDGIGLPVVVPWSHSESVGRLSAGTYSLTVRTFQFFSPDYELADSYATSFVVLPRLLLGDVNRDGHVNGRDIDPFVEVVLSGPYQPEADMNEDQVVDGLDVDPFVAAVVGGSAAVIPEPSTLLLCLAALFAVGGWRTWRG